MELNGARRKWKHLFPGYRYTKARGLGLGGSYVGHVQCDDRTYGFDVLWLRQQQSDAVLPMVLHKRSEDEEDVKMNRYRCCVLRCRFRYKTVAWLTDHQHRKIVCGEGWPASYRRSAVRDIPRTNYDGCGNVMEDSCRGCLATDARFHMALYLDRSLVGLAAQRCFAVDVNNRIVVFAYNHLQPCCLSKSPVV